MYPFSRNRREDSDGVECESDSWSDDSGSDNLCRSVSNDSSKSWDAISEDSSSEQGSCKSKDKLGNLYLNYTEMSSPYLRVPLMEKVTYLPSILSCSICFPSPHLSRKIDRCNIAFTLYIKFDCFLF
jgi:hypothetical protein